MKVLTIIGRSLFLTAALMVVVFNSSCDLAGQEVNPRHRAVVLAIGTILMVTSAAFYNIADVMPIILRFGSQDRPVPKE